MVRDSCSYLVDDSERGTRDVLKGGRISPDESSKVVSCYLTFSGNDAETLLGILIELL